VKGLWPILLLFPISALVARDRKQQIRDAVKRVTSRDATDVAGVCCDKQGDTFIYIGLAGDSSRTLALNPEPTEQVRVSPELADLSQRMNQAMFAAVRSGNAAEEQPSDGKQRAIAADALGFANRSPRQIAALVHARRDSDDDVRNNATRALLEMAQAGPAVASQIPLDTFIDMLWSGVWSDRNKASGLFWILTASRDPQLLSRLRDAFDPLIEIARWDIDRSIGARMILGPIGGIPDSDLFKIVTEDPPKIPGILPVPSASKP
jgi:hypothetical protein